jgi:hypothetical protein
MVYVGPGPGETPLRDAARLASEPPDDVLHDRQGCGCGLAGLILVLLLAGLAAGCLNAGPGACTPEAAAAFNEIKQYGGIHLEPQDYPSGFGGRCVATFTSADPPAVVLDYYRAQWTAAGWTLDPSSPLASAPPAGEGVPDFVFGGASAHKNGTTYSVTAFKGQETRYELLVGADH